MSSLEQRIADWRARLGEDPIYGTADLDELEGHLQESVSSLVQKGLSEEEAFWVATHRLGSAETLSEEYGKVSGSARWRTARARAWGKRFFWGSNTRRALCFVMTLLVASPVSMLLTTRGAWMRSAPAS